MKLYKRLSALVLVASLLALSLSQASKVYAGTLTATSALELGGAANVNPMIVSDGQSVAIDFTTANSTSGTTTITATFTGWTGGASGSVNATQTVATNGCTSLFPGSIAVPGTLTAAGSGAVVTISAVTAMAATTNYCTELTSASAVTNPTAPGDYSVTLTTASDSKTFAIDVLSSGANAYSITGTVSPIFTMSLSGATDTFSGNLSSSAVTTSTGITTTINTNALSGWLVWAEDSNAGLKSTTNGHTIATVSTGSNHTLNGGAIGTEAYALGVATNNTTNYAYGGGTTGGGLSTSAFNEIATSASPASNVTFVSHELADISATTPPATDYTDTITLIGAGSF